MRVFFRLFLRLTMKAAKLDYDDVYQDLAIRLIRCMETFDPDEGTIHTHIYSQLQYELINCKTPRKLISIKSSSGRT